MNLNELATKVAEREGMKKSVNIAQVKEVIRNLCDIYAELGFFKSFRLFRQMRSNGQARVAQQ